VAKHDEAGVWHFPVRFGDGIGVHHEILGHFSNARELVSWRQGSQFDGVSDLLDQLQVHGNAGLGIDTKHDH
jgi:hypothetical protein